MPPAHCCRPFVLLLLLVLSPLAGGAETQQLIHWRFDEGTGSRTEDASGNALHGTVGASWTESPLGHAVLLDGRAQSVVTVRVPEPLRLGTGSWTFSAWIKPIQLSIESSQNQRRLFSYGRYPDANLVIDVTAGGAITAYLCYRDSSGAVVSTGASSPPSLSVGRWAHVALVVDRQAGKIWPYINGYCVAPSDISPQFTGRFDLDGSLTLGSSWQNFWGAVDEVKLYRRALTPNEVRDAFLAARETFGVAETEQARAFHLRETIVDRFAAVNRAWSEKKFSAVRRECQSVLAHTDAAPQLRSYAHLRLAQSHVAEGESPLALAEYLRIAADEAYPEVHRQEASRRVEELRRSAEGLAPRDPSARRVRIPDIESFAHELVIAPHGDDAAEGSQGRPFATLTRARDAIRSLRRTGVSGPIRVRILPGQYVLREPFVLTSEDSGTSEAPIVYHSERPGAAVFYGGRVLTGFEKVTDPEVLERLPVEARDQVLQCDLRQLGIDDLGQLRVRGFAQPPSPPTVELFVDGRPMQLARWPNTGFVGIRRLIEGGSRAQGTPSVFEYESDRHARWVNADDAWLFGYFQFLWADATIKIGAIDPAARTVTTAEPYDYGGRGMSTEQGIIYYAFNLLEEIDEPGEWYLDRKQGRLYLFPPTQLERAVVEMGMLSTPMVVLDNVSHVRLDGLTFDLARFDGIDCKNSRHCLIAGCTVSRMAGNGVLIHGGEGNGLWGCDIHTIGRRGAEVIGGDRETLTPGNHFVENCRIHSFGRIDRTYTPAIQLEGVGNRVAYNLLSDAPSSVMRIEGNDHTIEFNEIHSAVRESDDQGAIDIFANPSYRGNVFRHNLFHHIGKAGDEVQVHGQAAIRFDDAISGQLVYGNIFYRASGGNFGAVQMNSGRDNVMDNNLFVECPIGISGGWYPGNSVWRQLRDGRPPRGIYLTDLYFDRYPAMRHMLEEPAVNYVWRNLFYRCGQLARGNAAHLDLLENGFFPEQDPGFVDAQSGDFRLAPGTTAWESVGFEPIPLDEIGLYEDPRRASPPVASGPPMRK